VEDDQGRGIDPEESCYVDAALEDPPKPGGLKNRLQSHRVAN
jgi:hypothetical protein